jgi:hypothetical protein
MTDRIYSIFTRIGSARIYVGFEAAASAEAALAAWQAHYGRLTDPIAVTVEGSKPDRE